MAEVTIPSPETLAANDAAYWSVLKGLRLQGGPFSFKDRLYQLGWMQSAAKWKCCMKATQLGFPLDVRTPVPTPDGWTTMEDIRVGERVFGTDGEVYRVGVVHPVKEGEPCYSVRFTDGSQIICDGDHLWTVRDEWHYRYAKTVTLRTDEMAVARKRGTRNRFALDVNKPLVLEDKALPVGPYVLGLWLGDGNSYSAQITCHVSDAPEYAEVLKRLGVSFEVRANDARYPDNRNIKLNGLHPRLTALGVIKNKHIPPMYLRASYAQRLELLRGLMDTDGHVTKHGTCEFYNTNMALLLGVKELLHTLGYKAILKEKARGFSWPKPGCFSYPTKMLHRITFRAYSDVPVAKIKRKIANQLSQEGGRPSETNRRRIAEISPVESVPVRCIGVDSPDHLFLAGEDFIPVHNTELEVLSVLHGLIHGRYPRGVLYIFPTEGMVQDFGKARFNPLIEANREHIGRYVKTGGRGTDTASLKKIGRGFLYLRGARMTQTIDKTTGEKDSAQLTSHPVDKGVLDELDQMGNRETGIIEKVEGRMGASAVKELVLLGNPTVPDDGIAAQFEESDQRYWFRTCGACGTRTSAEESFPGCVKERPDGTGYIACTHCGRELPPDGEAYDHKESGVWVPKYPGRSMEGYHLSQLTSIYNDPMEIVRKLADPPDGDPTNIYRLRLGLPYIRAEDRLTPGTVRACCGSDAMSVQHAGPCCMGVDPHKPFYVVIGCRIDRERYEVLKVAAVAGWPDVHDLARRFGVRCAVADIRPYEDSARAFQKVEPYRVWLCEYGENATADVLYSEDENGRPDRVKVNRTQIFDATHRLLTERKMLLPRLCPDVEGFIGQCCGAAKMLETNERTGQQVYRYRKVGKVGDHYRNALNYMVLAANKVGVAPARGGYRTARPERADSDYAII